METTSNENDVGRRSAAIEYFRSHGFEVKDIEQRWEPKTLLELLYEKLS
ncbi:hypothetical protein SPFM1_00161 [Salmonella phage SPFM1]|nr:hypothetical protein SPFM1_00161 [Salmonella phage SPFM1]